MNIGIEDFFLGMHAENHEDSASGWRKWLQFEDPKKGVTKAVIYSKKYDGFPVEFMRSCVTFPGISLDIFDSFMRQRLDGKSPVEGKKFDIIEKDADGRPSLIYIKTELNRFVADRDTIISIQR